MVRRSASAKDPPLSILIAILGFNVLIIVHELGHFLLARAGGMTVETVSIGFGQPFFKVTHKGVAYQLGWFPVGGYVHVSGMIKTSDAAPKPGTYHDSSLLARALMVSAGPAFNFAMAAAIYFYLFASANSLAYSTGDIDYPMLRRTTTVIGKVTGPAEAAGLLPGDTVLKMNGTPIKSFRDMLLATGASDGAPITIVVARPPEDSESIREIKSTQIEGLIMLTPTLDSTWPQKTFTVIPNQTSKGFRLGISPDLARFGSDSMGSAIKLALVETWRNSIMIVVGLGQYIRGDEGVEVGSVVKITQIGADSVKRGSEWFLNLLAMLSVSLGMLNLLPVPALDGGRLMFIVIEAVARRPVPRKLETVVHAVGFLLLMGLIAVLMVKDIVNLFTGDQG